MRDASDGGSAGGKGGGWSFMLWVDEVRGCRRTGGSWGAGFLTSLGGSGPGELCENKGCRNERVREKKCIEQRKRLREIWRRGRETDRQPDVHSGCVAARENDFPP